MECGEDGRNDDCYPALGYGFAQTKAKLPQLPTHTIVLSEFADRCSCTVPLMTRSSKVRLQLHGVASYTSASEQE